MKSIAHIGLFIFIYLLPGLCTSQTPERQQPAYQKMFNMLSSDIPKTMDPQASSRAADHQLTQHIFDPLFAIRHGEPIPILIANYQWKTPTQWEFSLKRGVKFHDNSELTSKDVIATFKRAFRLQNNTWHLIKDYSITALGKYRFRVDTKQPNSELLWDLEDIHIINHTAEFADEKSFNSGQSLIGTGPYRLIKRQNFDELELTAFRHYHRGQAFIRNLKIRTESDSQKRVEALLANEADLIDYVPDQLLKLLPDNANIYSHMSNVVYFMAADVHRDQSPDIFDLEGKPLLSNPLKDVRVRKAISKAIDRSKLLLSIYGKTNANQIAGQLVNNANKTANPTLSPDKQDIDEARRLLKAAGYPNGFQLILRDKHARQTWLEEIARMLNKIGIVAKVKTLPAKDYFSLKDKHSYSAAFSGYTTDGNLTNMLKQLLYTDAKINSGRYSNPELDKQIDNAMKHTSITLKRRALRKAQNIAIHDMALIPLLFMSQNWVIRKDMLFNPTDQAFSEAYYVLPVASSRH